MNKSFIQVEHNGLGFFLGDSTSLETIFKFSQLHARLDDVLDARDPEGLDKLDRCEIPKEMLFEFLCSFIVQILERIMIPELFHIVAWLNMVYHIKGLVSRRDALVSLDRLIKFFVMDTS